MSKQDNQDYMMTELDEFGNANIIGIENKAWQLGLSFNDMNRVTDALNKLYSLEFRERNGCEWCRCFEEQLKNTNTYYCPVCGKYLRGKKG
jgi:Zn finger protein HypA/HybF involved in hydrogenase expression